MLPLKDNIPTRAFPILTIAIIAICCVVYVLQCSQGGSLISGPSARVVVDNSFIPYELRHPGKHCGLTAIASAGGQRAKVRSEQTTLCEGTTVSNGETRVRIEKSLDKQPSVWLTLLFAMFMHGSLLHIAGNMLFLWIFGNNVEDSMGKPRFAAFYLLGGLVATAAQFVSGPSSTTPNLGASGAIAAVLGGYALLYPRARVVTLIFIVIFVTVIELPALLVLGVWFLLQLADASAQHGDVGGGVAYLAHIGGFIFGLLFIRMFANRAQDDYVRRNRIPVY